MASVVVEGTLTFISKDLVNPYTGEIINLTGDYYINDTYIDGGPGTNDLLSGSSQNQYFRLEDELGNLLIENIEFIAPGSGDDVVDMSSATRVLGDLIIATSSGNDIVWSNAGNDTIFGGNGNDILNGGLGDDTIDGGNDDDILIGGAGADSLDGGAGIDTADYSGSSGAVRIDLQNNVFSGGDATGDSLTSIENVIGSDSASRDYLYGDNNDNTLYGGRGSDYLEGGGGADNIDGGTHGWDYAMYTRSDAAININMGTGIHTGGHAEGDTITNIEAIIASSYDDTLRGSNAKDYFLGEAGNDYLHGSGGKDILYGGDGNDSVNGGSGKDRLYGGNGNDTLDGGSSADKLYGNSGADTFLFKAATALYSTDTIQDFSLADGDKIDISDLLQGYDPLTDAISDFVQITDNGTNSILSVDVNGGANSFVHIATLNNITGLTDEDALEASGNLVTV